MSTYLPGVQDYIPQIQPFEPDYNFYNQALDFKQGKHDAARSRLSTLYGSLLNSPLTRTDNIQVRENFFKTIEQDIKKISGTDLSLAQNQTAAAGIFNQILDNKGIKNDMIWTKNFYNEMQRSEGFKNCKDPKKCGGQWWEGGEKLLQYDYQDFRNASASEALNKRNAEFVPYQDVTKMAMELAKEADLNVEIDQSNGSWIITNKNGKLVEPSLQKLFMGSIGNDPNVQAYYKSLAKLKRKDFGYANQSQYGSVQAAEQAFSNEMGANLMQQVSGISDASEEEVEINNKTIDKIESAIDSYPLIQRKRLEALHTQYKNLGQAYQATADYSRNVEGNTTVVMNNQQFMPDEVDGMLAHVLLATDVNSAAKLMSARNASSKMKVDPYGMESVKQRNRLWLAQQKFEYSKQLKSLDQVESSINKGLTYRGTNENNTPVRVSNVKGGLNVGENQTDDQVAQREHTAYQKDKLAILQDITSPEKTIVKAYIELTKSAASDDPTAQMDFINMINTAVFSSNDEDIINEYVEATDKKGLPIGELYTIATKYEEYLDKVDPVTLNKLYQQIETNLNPKDNTSLLRPHLENFNTDHQETILDIQAQDLVLSQLDQDYVSDIQNVVNRVRVDNPMDADAIEAYIDAKGNPNDIYTFMKNMKDKGYSPEVSYDMYALDPEDFDDTDKVQYKLGNYYTRYAKNNNELAWLAMKGLANSKSYGGQYTLDPAAKSSVSTVGAIQILTTALNDDTSIFNNGSFSETPLNSDATAKDIMQLVYDELTSPKNHIKNADRSTFTMTYLHNAGSDPTKAAVNIKLPLSATSRYKTLKDDEGVPIFNLQALATEGVTVYFDKTEVPNMITEGSELTAPEILMRRVGEIKYDQNPDFIKDFKIKLANGKYNITGKVLTGYDNSAKGVYKTLNNMEIPYGSSLNDVLSKTNAYYLELLNFSKDVTPNTK